jgi:hypothetical protein
MQTQKMEAEMLGMQSPLIFLYKRIHIHEYTMVYGFLESMVGKTMCVSWEYKEDDFTVHKRYVGRVIDKNTILRYHEFNALCNDIVVVPDSAKFEEPNAHTIRYYLSEKVPDPHSGRSDVIEYDKWVDYVLPKCLSIADVSALKPGDRIKVLLMDRNLGDTVCEVNKSDTIYDVHHYFKDKVAVYEHTADLHGNAVWDYQLMGKDLSNISALTMTDTCEFDINYKEGHWYPLAGGRLPVSDKQGLAEFGDVSGKHYSEFPPTTLIGWRGPMMLWERLDELPVQQIYWHDEHISWEEAHSQYMQPFIGKVMNIEWKKYNSEGKLKRTYTVAGKIVDECHYVRALMYNKFDTKIQEIPKDAKLKELYNCSKKLYLYDAVPDPELNGIKHSEWRAYVKDKCLTIADVLALKPGERIKVITMDRNEWECSERANKPDVLHDVHDFFRQKVSVYIHKHDLVGEIAWDFVISHKNMDDYYSFEPDREFEFDINYRGSNWYPLTNGRLPPADPQGLAQFGDAAGKHYSEFPPTTLIGWRGPMMLWERLAELPIQQIYWHDKLIPLTEEEKREDKERHIYEYGPDDESDDDGDEPKKEHDDSVAPEVGPGMLVEFH